MHRIPTPGDEASTIMPSSATDPALEAFTLQDKQTLIKALGKAQIFQSVRGRRSLLELAGLASLIPFTELEGTPVLVATEFLSVLESTSSGNLRFFNLMALLGACVQLSHHDSDLFSIASELLQTYSLPPGVDTHTSSMNWRGPFEPPSFEKIIGENTLKHIYFLEQAVQAAKSVMLIRSAAAIATGVLIKDNLVLTNNHVIPTKQALRTTECIFNYQLNSDCSTRECSICLPNISGIFRTNRLLDYTVFELLGSPGRQWGVLPVSTQQADVGDRIYIIQHPGGQAKQVAFQNNFVEYADEGVLQYTTPTVEGSSGSPVCNSLWQVIALHHAGGMVAEPKTQRRFFRNEGITMRAIVSDLADTDLFGDILV